jgi:large subunit ribosomal protein L22
MPGLKTNEREGTRAVLRHTRISAYKVREVLDLVRGKPVHEAEDILRFSDRDAAITVGKVLHSAVANAENNDELDPEELYVSACFADEGTTIKRWRPRARGRATRIRKRTSHITVIVSRLPEEQLQRLQARRRAEQLAQRARRVAAARRAEGDTRTRAERRAGVAIEEPTPEETEVEAETEAMETEAGDATATGSAEGGKPVAEADTDLVSDTSAGSAADAEAEGDAEVEAGAPIQADAAEAEETAAEETAGEETAAEEPATDEADTEKPGEDTKEKDEK